MAERASGPVWRPLGATRSGAGEQRTTVAIVGGGPVGLTAALDLARRGHRIVLLQRFDYIAAGSKAICFSKRSLEIFDQLGIAEPLRARGVTWNIGKVFRGGGEPVYRFDLLPVKDQKQPAFINIQQYYVEAELIESLGKLSNVELRFGHTVTGVRQDAAGATLSVSGADGDYSLAAKFVLACDGARSSMRDFLELNFDGNVFEDHFLIADIRVRQERPAERWFWFDPPFNPGQSALLHKQPDDVWRLDFQLGPNIDRVQAVRPENVERFVRGMLGNHVEFEPVWYSIYNFRCCRMASFVHGRVIFAGDAAHLVSPFGARGCNGGIADAYNLGWKLDRILAGRAGAELLESYDHESSVTAEENIRQATRATHFMSAKTGAERALRDAVLSLASEHEFARPFVNSGRLSSAVAYPDSRLNSTDIDSWRAGPAPGSPAIDAPFAGGYLSERLGAEFVLLSNDWGGEPPAGLRRLEAKAAPLLLERYDLTPGSAYLFRPDQYVAARFKSPTTAQLKAALRRAGGDS